MKIKLLAAVLIYIFIFQNGICQNPLVKQWDKKFGGTFTDWLSSFQQTMDGGYILGGWSQSGINGDKTQPLLDTCAWCVQGDFWVIKIDALGNKQWDKDFGGLRLEVFTSIFQTADRGYILGGYSYSGIGGDKTQPNWDAAINSSPDYWIIKTDSLGNKQWDKRFGGTNIDKLYSVKQTSDGGYILGGFSFSGIGGDKTQPSKGIYDFWIVKTDALGTKQWDKDFGGTSDDALYSLEQTDDGGYILGGYSWSGISGDKTQDTWGDTDYWIIKIDSLGNKQWDKDFGGKKFEYLYSIHQTTDGGYILGGCSNTGIHGDKTEPSWGSYDFWIIKIDSLGNKQWDKDFGGTAMEGGTAIDDDFGSISQTTDGGYLVAGPSFSGISGNKTENNLGIKQSWIIKTDSFGNMQWDKTLLTTGQDEIGYAFQTQDGCFAMANYTNGGVGGDKTQPSWGFVDYWIIKFCDSTLTTGVSNFQPPPSAFQVSPNPATDKIYISFPATVSENITVKIYSITGEVIFESPLTKGATEMEVPVGDLGAGIYFLSLQTEKQVLTKKVIVQP